MDRRRAWVMTAFVAAALAAGAAVPFMGKAPEVMDDGRVRLTLAVERYSVSADTVEGLERELARKGPRRFWGYASYVTRPVYGTQVLGDGTCALTDPRVEIDARIRIPRLSGVRGTPACVASSFADMVEKLEEHERVHVEIGRQGAAVLAARMRGLASGTCESLEAEVGALAMQVKHETDMKQVRFDRETAHGVRDGAVLRPCP